MAPLWTADSVFTTGQQESLQSVIDGLLPPLLVPPRDNDASTQTPEHKTYYESRLATDPVFRQALLETFSTELSTADRLKIQSLLTLLSSSFGTSLLLARPTKAFVQCTVPQRSLALSQLQHSTRTHHQHLYRLLQQWICRTAYTYVGNSLTATRNKKTNPNLAALGYAPSIHGNDGVRSSSSLHSDLVYNDKIQAQTSAAAATDSNSDAATSLLVRIDCDILIVGSGPASAVAASVLGKAGYKVLVVEQGSHYGQDHHIQEQPQSMLLSSTAAAAHKNSTTSSFSSNSPVSWSPMHWTDEGTALRYAYGGSARYGGTQQCAPMILAGSTLGGGSTIGYGACLPMSETVWKEWLQTIFSTSSDGESTTTSSNSNSAKDAAQRLHEEYMAAMDFVTHKLGLPALTRRNHLGAIMLAPAATSNNNANGHPLSMPHNAANLKLLQACDRMGYPWQTMAQTYGDKMDLNAGYYSGLAGDRNGNKKTSLTVFLHEAAKFGVRVLDHCRVDRILLEAPTRTSDRPRAMGVECTLGAGNLPVRICASRAIVMGAGSLHTPCLLQKSKLRNRHIGKHLKLHPTTTVFGFMETPVDSYLGLPQTVVCNEFERGPKQNGHGARIMCQNLHPGLLSTLLAWTTPYEYKERIRKFRKIVPLAIQQRDLAEGSVKVGLDGFTPVVRYRLSFLDRVSMTQALQGGVKLLATAGAREIVTSHIRDPGIVLGSGPHDMIHLATDPRLQRYLASLPRLGMKPYDMPLFSTYQTGTCRMSSSPADGVVDTNGECWEVDNLFVMDTSIFPSSPGVNPMLTILVLAKMLGSRLSLRLRHEDRQPMSVGETAKVKAMIDARAEARSSFHPKAGRLPSLADMIPHILLWVSVLLIFLPLIFSAVTPVMEVPTEMPPSLVNELTKSPFKLVKSAWREAADFLTFW